ncbi:VanZ family protein [Bacillus alkalicellulosilyticus]|uniref:VanZ family protein n=1 Tax=Alkalihalobacterium alkalicellulosilyticum TaxID=1912214 RepID=UPI00099616C6|nr:VanZ family protein [Bacillus alkalicellulosilyticus]
MKKRFFIILLFSQILFIVLIPFLTELTFYLHPLVLGVVWFCYSSLFVYGVLLFYRRQVAVPLTLIHAITICYALALLVLLFFRPQGTEFGTINLLPFETIGFYLSGQVNGLIALYNLSANVGLFIPFGLYYQYTCKRKPSFWRLLLITSVTISLIESLQFLTRRGSLDIDDLLLNVAGVTIGYFLFPLVYKVIKTARPS